MTAKAMVVGAVLTATLGGCGGGGSSGGAPLSDGTDGLCAEPFFRRIIGVYEGVVTFGRSEETEPEELLCEWDMSIAVRPRSSLPDLCYVEAVVTSEMRQSVIYAAGDDRAFQCLSPDSLLTLTGPHDTSSSESLSVVLFPVSYGYLGGVLEPARGPYFGNASVTVPYIQLFTSSVRIVDSFRFDGAETLELVSNPGPNLGHVFEGSLLRVSR